MESIYALGLGYVLGSIPFGLILTRLFGAGDLRSIGSGSIGATNVLRTGRKGLAAGTLLLDAGKGALAVWLASLVFDGAPLEVALAGLGAMIGHCFPVWLRFHGGKGVATMLGVGFALDWRIGLASLLAWLVTALLTRISSLGGIISSLAAPVAAAGMYWAAPLDDEWAPEIWEVTLRTRAICLAAMAAIVLWRHRENIARLIAGTEPKIGQKG